MRTIAVFVLTIIKCFSFSRSLQFKNVCEHTTDSENVLSQFLFLCSAACENLLGDAEANHERKGFSAVTINEVR